MQDVPRELLDSFVSPSSSSSNSFFLSFEGIEASGKSTQILNAKNHLEKKNFRTVVLREPGGTSFGEKLREAMLNSSRDIHPVAQAYLFASSRAQLLQEVILKELGRQDTAVICDRYIDSTLAYQGVAEGLGVSTILQMHTLFPLNIVPHKSFYLKISVETSLERQKIRNTHRDYFESKDTQFHRDLARGHDLASVLFPKRICVIDGEKSIEDVTQNILREIDDL